MDRPRLSIVLPAFNEEDQLEANLTAILREAESLADVFYHELIVVDDGSTDRTGELVKEFARSHDNVIALSHHHNLGLGQALKTGFAACRGQYIITYDPTCRTTPATSAVLRKQSTCQAPIWCRRLRTWLVAQSRACLFFGAF